MERIRIAKAGIILMVAVLVFTFLAGCGGDDSTKSSYAELTSITVGGEASDTIPDPTDSNTWNDAEFLLYDMDFGRIFVDSVSDPLTVALNASSGSTVKYAIGGMIDKPEQFETIKGNTDVQFAIGDSLYIQVTSESGSTVNYYRFSINEKSGNATLSIVTIAGKTATNGNYATTWDGSRTSEGMVSLSNADKTNATVTATVPVGATVKFAKLAKDATDAPVFDDTSVFTFADEDSLYVEVTSANGATINYYKIMIEIGRDATLTSVAIGGAAQVSETYIGLAADTWQVSEDDTGSFQLDSRSMAGYKITIVPNDKEAEVSWGVAIGDAEPTFAKYTAAVNNYQFADVDNEYLYIKVVSSSGSVTKFYKMSIVIPMKATINYGTPSIIDDIDPIWDEEDYWFDISRVNQAESIAAWFKQPWGQHTSARAKALWDDDGIWVYAEVSFKDYKTTENGATLTRKAGIPAVAVAPGTNDHMRDSLEVFVNERLQYLATLTGTGDAANNWGVQYRADPQTPPALSGDGGQESPTGANEPITAYRNAGNTKAWLLPNNEGYIVVTQVPWVFGPNGAANETNKERASDVWNANGTIKDDAVIGFELQINACSVSGTRDGILTWNGVNTQAYHNARGYGEVVLSLGGRQRVVNANNPVISQQPVSKDYLLTDTIDELSVTATVADSGTITYQWYDAVDDSAIDGETAATFDPGTLASGTYKYYVIVTNTIADNGDGGVKVRNVKSNTATIKVMSIIPPQINAQPALTNTYTLSTPITLSVKAESLDEGNLTYQWYSATSSTGTGTAITGATTATYYHSVSLPGTYYFYVNITNTDASDPTVKDTVKSNYSEAVVLPVNGDLVEKLSLENGGYAVYRFDLPDGAKWSDYTDLTVDYKVDAENILKGIRGSRLMGVYKATDFTNGNASLNNFNAPYIIDNTNTTNWTTLGATADTWFTVTYSIAGTKPPAHNDFANLPDADATGPFYFALGITGNTGAADAITQLVKNITLVSTDTDKNVVSHGSGFAVSASVAYYSTEVVREWYMDESSTPFELVEKLVLNEGALAIYKFTLPNGVKWSDFEMISAEFKVDADNLTKGFRNGQNVARLYGPYDPNAFGIVTGDIRYASFNDSYDGVSINAGHIIAQTAMGGSNFEAAGFVADTWKAIEYLLDGSTKHADFNASRMPADDATGPFYFGIGCAGGGGAGTGNANLIEQLVKNVTMVHKTDPDKNLVSYGSGFAEATFVSYPPVTLLVREQITE